MLAVRALFLAIVLVPGVSAQFEFERATVTGAARLAPAQAITVLQPGEDAWEFSAVRAVLRVVDDREDHMLPNPLKPGEALVSVANRTETVYDVEDARIRWNESPGLDTVSIVTLGRVDLALNGSANIRPEPATIIESSHVVPEGGLGGRRLEYNITAPPGLGIEATGSAALALFDDVQMYSWGSTIIVNGGGQEVVVETGRRESADPTRPGAWTVHHVHAFLDLEGVTGTLRLAGLRSFAQGLELDSAGTIVFAGANGDVATQEGVGEAAGGTVTTVGGAFDVGHAGGTLQAAVTETPTEVLGLRQASSSAWPWLLAAGVGMPLAAVVLAPSLYGRWLGRDSILRGLAPRAEAYATLASRADNRGYRSLAALLCWRAVRAAPHDPEMRCEYGILLQQAGRDQSALVQHTKAAHLLALQPDPGCAGLNAFNAAIACARLARTDDAVDWLRVALEADPGLRRHAAASPELRSLRGHEDFEALRLLA